MRLSRQHNSNVCANQYQLVHGLIRHYRITAYLRLVVLAAGFRDAYMSGQLTGESAVLKQSVDSARTVIQITVERLFPTGHLRYAMEANFIYVSFAAAYLINVSLNSREDSVPV